MILKTFFNNLNQFYQLKKVGSLHNKKNPPLNIKLSQKMSLHRFQTLKEKRFILKLKYTIKSKIEALTIY